MSHVTLFPPAHPIRVSIQLPFSKSISNRALIMAALGHFRHALFSLSDADDTRRLDVLVNERPYRMDCGAGGTTLRFLLAWASIQEQGQHLITGVPRLLQRPHDALVDALRRSGASIQQVAEGFLVKGKALEGGEVVLERPESSQFISALLMIAPYMKNGLRVIWKGEQESVPYVRMTCDLMRRFGAGVEWDGDRITVAAGSYFSEHFAVSRDLSAAAFWYEIAAMAKGARIQLIGAHDDGSQGDAAAADLWDRWVITERNAEGIVLHHRTPTENVPMEFDLKDTPDLFQPLIMTAAALAVKANFSGLRSLPLKETDRIAAITLALRYLGAPARMENNVFSLDPWRLIPLSGQEVPVLDTAGDHRMAMALAPLSLMIPGLRLSDPDVVEKSYPYFWDHLELAGFKVAM